MNAIGMETNKNKPSKQNFLGSVWMINCCYKSLVNRLSPYFHVLYLDGTQTIVLMAAVGTSVIITVKGHSTM